ncbi:hypothetical protein AAEU28_12045 [Pseudoalteromonas sp. SS15]|uniref:hypothetical protein n=1 Tax=Pseudoalteromonas sp. SS15 TaxID=3139393 RepID=UPI003BA8B07E
MSCSNFPGRIEHISEDDSVISEINWLIEKIYKPAHENADKLSKLTRSLSVIFSVWATTLISLFVASEFIKDLNLFEQSAVWDGFDVNYIWLALMPTSLFSICVSFRNWPTKNTTEVIEGRWRKKQSFLLALGCLFFPGLLSIYFFKETVLGLGIVSLMSFVACYMVNRLFGYTSSSIRNQTMMFHLQRLKREYEIALSDACEEESKLIKQETLAAIYSLVENVTDRRDREIMGDHFKVHDSAFKWVKGLKK